MDNKINLKDMTMLIFSILPKLIQAKNIFLNNEEASKNININLKNNDN
jgi:hypothetical protein